MNFDCGIYCITSPSGRRYIGQAQSFEKRWFYHRYHLRAGTHKNRHLQNAWNKYSGAGFVFAKIAIVPLADLDRREQEQINAYAPSELYNIALEVGYSRRGVKTSDETRAKISASKKLQYATKGNPRKGRKLPPETIAKMSAAMKGKTPSPETRAKISATNKGRCLRSPEAIKRSADKRRGQCTGADHVKARAVICVQTGKWFASITLAVDWLRANGKPKADRSCVAKVCKMDGRQKSAYGFEWRYAEEQAIAA